MISIDGVVAQMSGLTRQDLEAWIGNDWVRPDGRSGHYAFRPIDVARVRLIQQLRIEMLVNDEALPIVLLLLDQLYEHRRRLREFSHQLAHAEPEELRRLLALHLMTGRDDADHHY
jgi:chaperone modulatory protein CbpM